MKKVGILTFHQVMNYGAVLQCYALKQVIEENGFYCEIIPHCCKKLEKNETMLKFNKRFGVNLAKYLSQGWGTKRKRKGFNIFLKEYCKMNLVKGTFDVSQYDSIVVGSDQVWNLKLTENDYTYLLEEVVDTKKIAYAVSFGEVEVPEQEKTRLIRNIADFDAISVREKAGCNWLQENSINATVVCDPVLLWGSNNWINLVKDLDFGEKQPYILVYCVEKSSVVFDYARKIAREKNWKIIYLNQNMFFKEKGMVYRRGVSPILFLQYVYNANYVVTNSFHGTAFSILFQKQFATDAIWHGKTNIRVNELLEIANLENRKIQKIISDDYCDVYTPIEYADVNKKLENVQNTSFNFLKHALMQ